MCIRDRSYSDEMGDKARRSYLLEQFYYYICDEIVPRIKEINGTGKMIYTTGCSLGATHATNMMLRRPDLFMGCVASVSYTHLDVYKRQNQMILIKIVMGKTQVNKIRLVQMIV